MAEHRYSHFLQRAKGGRWPSVVVVVDCISQSIESTSDRYSQSESLVSWHAAVLTLRDHTYGVTRYVTANSRNQWWKNVSQILRNGIPCAVIAANAQRVWALLGVWDALEDGTLSLSADPLSAAERHARAVSAVRLSQPDPLAPISQSQYSREIERDVGFIVLNDPPNIIQCYYKSCKPRLTLLDVRNYGVEPDSTWSHGPNIVSRLSLWINDYCQACKAANLGSMQTTAASQAMHGFRAGHMGGIIYVNGSATVTACEQRSYHGGRCEAYHIGVVSHALWYLDIRASYPFVCATQFIPVRCRSHCTNPGGTRPTSGSEWSTRIAVVRIRTDHPSYPLTHGDITIYPVGTFRTTLCGPELCDAIEHGCVEAVYEYTEYDMEPTLRSFAQSLYDMRESADDSCNRAISQTAKRIAVSLPGKFGQRTMAWRTRYDCQTDGKWWQGIAADELGRPALHRYLGSIVQIQEHGEYHHDAVPSIAAWITSAGRVALLAGIRAAGWDHTYYCDTDAIMCDSVGRDNLLNSGLYKEQTWGRFGHRWGPETVEIRGIKYYIHDGETVCAGMPRGCNIEIDDEDAYIHYASAQDTIRRGEMPHIESRTLHYSRTMEYRHGVVSQSGRVLPHTMVE